MWKYVSHRVKETFERKCNVLDVRKSAWLCGALQQVHRDGSTNFTPNQLHPSGADSATLCVIVPNRGEGDVPYVHCVNWSRSRARGDEHNKRKGCIIGELLGAITWSGAIVFGWYASQLICLNRRHETWEKKTSRYWRMLENPARTIHTSFLSHLVLTSPNYPSLLSERTLLEKFGSPVSISEETKVAQPIVFDVNNDRNSPQTTEPEKQNVDEAVADLVTFLGETEYKMGVKSIAAGQYRQAVAHLKLATSHNHPGATFNLGLCYEKGLGLPRNMKRAMECYQIASSMGHPKAMFNLGVFYARGLGGLEKDYQAAEKCFSTAASLGQSEAIKALGGPQKRADYHEDYRSNTAPMSELIFEKNKTQIFATVAKFT